MLGRKIASRHKEATKVLSRRCPSHPVPAEGSAGGSWQKGAQGISKALQAFRLLFPGLALAQLELAQGRQAGLLHVIFSNSREVVMYTSKYKAILTKGRVCCTYWDI